MKKQVMLKMWSIRHMYTSISEALKAAWKLVKLKVSMKVGHVSFKFKKVDGSIREAIGTLAVDYDRKGTGKTTEETFNYYDITSSGWRSFKITNLI